MVRKNRIKSSKSLVRIFWKQVSKSFTDEQKQKVIPIDLPDLLCSFCNSKNVKWKNSLSFYYSCDECVPRGCSCNLYKLSERTDFSIDDYEYKLGDDNLEIPCEDWDRI